MDMRLNYAEWVIHRSLEDFNTLLREVGEESIPELQLRVKDLGSMGAELLKHYQKEVRIQTPFGGIRQPAMVLCNKIRHEFTNYDQVRDAMTDAVRSRGMDECRELELRLKLTQKVSGFVQAIINSLKCPVSVPGCIVQMGELKRANDRYTQRESGDIMARIAHLKC
jgi:hypothetical protein